MWIADDRKLISPYSQTFGFVGGDNGPNILKVMLKISFLKTKTLGRYIVFLFVDHDMLGIYTVFDLVFTSEYLIFLFLSVCYFFESLELQGCICPYVGLCDMLKSHTVTDLLV